MGDTDFRVLDAEIKKSREEIVRLQERVKALTARRGQRQAMVKQVQDAIAPPKAEKVPAPKA